MNIRFNVRLPNTDKFNGETYIKRLAQKQRESTIPDLISLFKLTVEGWEEKPEFSYKQTRTASSLSMSVFATGPHASLYALVSGGARAHQIVPTSSTWLRFQPGYAAGTRPGIIGSSSKRRFGGYVQAEGVKHPGFQAREFPKTIKEEFRPIFQADMAEALKP